MRAFLIRSVMAAATASAAALLIIPSNAAGTVPVESYGKTIEADIAHLEQLVELAKTKKGIPGRMKATAMLIAGYAQENLKGADADKMAALRMAALKVAEESAKKDNAEAIATAIKSLKGVAADPKADKKPMKLATLHKLDLRDVMDLFGSSAGGGMNIEKDLRAMKKDGVKDAKAAEILAVRTALIADLSIDLPPAFGGKKTKADWEKWNKDMKEQSADLAAEALKGAKADAKKMQAIANKLDATCVTCHNVFRED